MMPEIYTSTTGRPRALFTYDGNLSQEVSRDVRERLSDQSYANWAGASAETALAIPAKGLPGTAKKIETLSAARIDTSGYIAPRRVWSEDDGDTYDVDRAREGLAPLRRRIKAKGSSRFGSIITLRVNIGENCNVPAEAMLWKAFAASRFVDLAESAGFRVEVLAEAIGLNAYRGCGPRDTHLKFTAKRAETPLDIELLAGLLSPAWFRSVCFAMIRTQSPKEWGLDDSLGRCVRLSEAGLQKLITNAYLIMVKP